MFDQDASACRALETERTVLNRLDMSLTLSARGLTLDVKFRRM